MKRVLIVGNVLKDVYLRLDERENIFERDERGTAWLDVGFNEGTYPVLRRTSVYGGAAVSLEVLEKFGIEAQIAGVRAEVNDGKVEIADKTRVGYRYILCHDNEVAYLTPGERVKTAWETPSTWADWVLVDRSAEITLELVQQITKFAAANRTKIAMHLSREATPADLKLAQHADLIFAEEEVETDKPVCMITPQTLSVGRTKVRWHAEKAGLLTHLTTYSVVAAAVLGGMLNRSNTKDALRLARAAAEHATLDGIPPLEQLEEIVAEHKQLQDNLHLVAAEMVAPGKGILAADESGGSTAKQFSALDIVDDEQHRRDYRNLLFTTPGIEEYVNAIILFDETTRQATDDGRNFVEYLTSKGIIPGVKVDKGLANMPGSAEKYTMGLEGLAGRMREYYRAGLRFAKWRAALEIKPDMPSELAIERNCEILVEYAKICQEENIVPIVEPEVVYDGEYPIEKCAEVTGAVLDKLFEKLATEEVRLDGCILKCNMVLAGARWPAQSAPAEVGEWTSKVLREHVPAELAGVVFLSGGQSVEQATDNLRAVEQAGPYPWPVTFSFARALQGPAMEIWRGDNTRIAEAQEALRERLEANKAALA